MRVTLYKRLPEHLHFLFFLRGVYKTARVTWREGNDEKACVKIQKYEKTLQPEM